MWQKWGYNAFFVKFWGIFSLFIMGVSPFSYYFPFKFFYIVFFLLFDPLLE